MSLYHSATGAQAPHCIHAIGIGKTGAYMVEALIRTGEIEDMLEDPRARFTGLSIDIGDQDQHELKEYAGGFDQRLAERGIPTERAQVRTISLEVPEKKDLMTSLNRWREFLKMEYPRYYWNPNYEPWLPSDTEMPKAGDSIPRAISKAIYGHYYYGESRSLEKERDQAALDRAGLLLDDRRHRFGHRGRPGPAPVQRQARPPDPGGRRGRDAVLGR